MAGAEIWAGWGEHPTMSDLEHVYEPPSDEQLVRFICVRRFGAGGVTPDNIDLAAAMLERGVVRESWLAEHRRFQEAVWSLSPSSVGGFPQP